MRSEGAETLVQWGALCSPLPCAPFSPFLSSEGHGTSASSPPGLPMTCREGLGGWEVWLVLEQEAGTDTRAFSRSLRALAGLCGWAWLDTREW